jgi:hypothetical protein
LPALAAVAVLASLAAACDGGAAGGQPETTTGTTMPGPEATIRYDRDVLYVGGVPLRQFPGFGKDELQKVPVGWSTADELVISAKSGHGVPVVAAAVFRPDNPKAGDPEALLTAVHYSLGDNFLEHGELVAEDTVTGPDRTCHLRVRSGPLSAREPDLKTVAGAVVAIGPNRPNVGVVVDAGPDRPIEQLTREIADALCRPA